MGLRGDIFRIVTVLIRVFGVEVVVHFAVALAHVNYCLPVFFDPFQEKHRSIQESLLPSADSYDRVRLARWRDERLRLGFGCCGWWVKEKVESGFAVGFGRKLGNLVLV